MSIRISRTGKLRWIGCVLGFAAWLALGTVGMAAATLLDGVAAHVNQDVITISDVMVVVQQQMQSSRHLPAVEQDRRLREAYDQILNELINQRLILQSYANSKMQLPEWVIDQRLEEIIEDRFSGDRSVLLAALSQDRMTYDDWRTRIREGIIVAALRSSQVERNVSISPEAVRSYYETHSAEMAQAAAAHVQLIVLRPDEGDSDMVRVKETSQQVLKRLGAGDSFAEVARRYSAGARAPDGGDWGWVTPDEYFRREIVQVLEGLKPGETSDLIETPEELYVVRKAGMRAPGTKPLEEARDEIENQLRREQAERLFRDWMARLRSEAYLKIFPLPEESAESE